MARRRLRTCGQWVVGIVVCLAASGAWGQEPPPRGVETRPSGTGTQAEPAPPTPVRPIAAYPLELLGLIAPPAQRRQFILTPSIGISEEYNDNVFADNTNRQWDFITNFSPTLVLSFNRPTLTLSAGYSFTAALYAQGTRPNTAFDSHNFILNGTYLLTPDLILAVSDSLIVTNYTSLAGSQGFSTGRQKSFHNGFSPSLTWQVTPLNSLSLGATTDVLRYGSGGSGISKDSETYGVRSAFTHAFTQRFSGNVAYDLTYIHFHGQESSISHSPTVGFSYLLTQTLTASVSGGAAITQIAGATSVTPAGTLMLAKTFQFGYASVQYTRNITPGGGFGGTADTQTAGAILALSTLWRGLGVVFNPTYSVANSIASASQQASQVDVKTFTLTLDAAYQLTKYVRLFAGYTFLHQRTGGSSSTQVDVDQNRVRVGAQFGYPFELD
jgi:hypothetical protein